MLAFFLLLAQAEPPADPFGMLKGTVVDAIRNCGETASGQILVCSRDRGFSEEPGNRLPKLVKPKVVTNDPVVTVQVMPTAPAR